MTPRWNAFLLLSLATIVISYRALTTEELPASDHPWYHYGARYDQIRFPVGRPCTAGPNGDGCLFGLFIGVGVTRSGLRVWNGRANTLALEQAFLRRGIIQPEHSRHLLDTETTPAAIAAASRTLGEAMRPNDVFLLFLNAHGGRDLATVSGGTLSEHALRRVIGSVPARQVIVLIEACQSGSFASLTHPGDRRHKTVIGAFSSGANELSWNDVYFREGSFTQALTAAVYAGSRDGTVDTADLDRSLQAFTQEHNRYVQSGWQHPLVRGPNLVLWRAYPYSWTAHQPFVPYHPE